MSPNQRQYVSNRPYHPPEILPIRQPSDDTTLGHFPLINIQHWPTYYNQFGTCVNRAGDRQGDDNNRTPTLPTDDRAVELRARGTFGNIIEWLQLDSVSTVCLKRSALATAVYNATSSVLCIKNYWGFVRLFSIEITKQWIIGLFGGVKRRVWRCYSCHETMMAVNLFTLPHLQETADNPPIKRIQISFKFTAIPPPIRFANNHPNLTRVAAFTLRRVSLSANLSFR